MNKKNNLRKLYLIYWITIGELFCVALIICALYILTEPLKTILTIMGIVGVIAIPVVTYILYRWIKRDNENNSDELEQMILTRAFANAGFCALSTLPVLLLVACLFPYASGYSVLGYTVLISGIFKISTYYYHKKY